MEKMYPHEFFQQSFHALPEVEAKRQEELLDVNQGEYALSEGMRSYFDSEVLPAILHNDWVFDSASEFVSRYAVECFRYWKLNGSETFQSQTRLLELKEKIIDFLARAHIAGAASEAMDPDFNLVNLRDYREYIRRKKLKRGMDYEERMLFQEAIDHEEIHLRVALRGIQTTIQIYCHESCMWFDVQ